MALCFSPFAAVVAALALAACSRPGDDSATGASANDAPGDDWSPSLTAWGEPDLRGMWPIDHLIGTPLERPPEFGDRRYMTDDEFAAEQAQVDDRNTRYDEEDASDRIGGGHWAEPTEALRLTSLIVDPPDGRFPGLTERGKALAETYGSSWTNTDFDSVADFDSWDRCITRGLPVSMLPRNYNNGIRILQSPGYVVISLEMAHESRIIPTGERPPLDPAVRQWLGSSRGHWEGNTLVVKTTNFNGRTGITNLGVPGSPRDDNPSSAELHIVERFTRTGPDTIEYEMTISDPVTLVRPFTVAYPMQRDDSYRMFEYACHEDNTAVRNYIEASRFERAPR